MGVDGQRHAPATLSPGKNPDTHSTGGWVHLRARLDGHGKGKKKSHARPGFEFRTVQHVASRYTDYTNE